MATTASTQIQFLSMKERNILNNKAEVTKAGILSFSERSIRFGLGNNKWIDYSDPTRATFHSTTEPTNVQVGDTWYNPTTDEVKQYVANADTNSNEWKVIYRGTTGTDQVINNSLEIKGFEEFINNLNIPTR